MKYRYFIYGVGDKTNAEDFDNKGLTDLHRLAELAADNHWGYVDVDAPWPIELGLVDESGKVVTFQVEMDYSPIFTAMTAEYPQPKGKTK